MSGKAQQKQTVTARIMRDHPVKGEYVLFRWTEQGERQSETRWILPANVEKERVLLEARVRCGLSPTPSQAASAPLTILDLLTRYGEDLVERQAGGEAHRANVVNRAANIALLLGKHVVSRVTIADLNSYLGRRRQQTNGGRRKNRSPKKETVKSEISLLRLAWQWGKSTGIHGSEWPGRPSFQGWPDDARPPRKLSDAEVALLVDTARTQGEADLASIVEFMAWCPRRPVAIFAMTRGHVERALDPAYDGRDLVNFVKDKGGAGRGWGPILPEARAVLVDRFAARITPPDALVWRTPTHDLALTAGRLGTVLARLARNAGVQDVHVYDLRKTAAVRAYRATGRSLRATMKFTGHLDPTTLLKHYLYDEDEAIMLAVRGAKVSP